MNKLPAITPFRILSPILFIGFILMGINTNLIDDYGKFLVVFFLIQLLLVETDLTLLRIANSTNTILIELLIIFILVIYWYVYHFNF